MLRSARFSCFAIIPLLTLALVTPGARAEVPKELKSKFSRAQRLVEDNCGKLVPNDSSPREVSNVADRLAKAKELAKEFPADLPEVVELRRQMAACDEMINKLNSATEAALASHAAADSTLEAGAKKDLENVQSASAALADVGFAAGSTATHMRTTTLDDLKGWPSVKAEAQRLIGAYGSLQATGQNPQARDMWLAVGTLKNDLARTQQNIAKFLGGAQGLVDKLLTAAERNAATALAAKDASAFTVGIRSDLRQAEFYLDQAETLYAAGEPGGPAWIATERTRIARVRERGKAVAEDVIKRNSLPKDSYSGADRPAIIATVTKAWIGKNPNSPPLKVILWSDWERVQRRVWKDGAWVKLDYSNLGASVVVKSKDGKYAYWYEAGAQKDHLNGNRPTAVVLPNEGIEVPADRTVLIGAAK